MAHLYAGFGFKLCLLWLQWQKSSVHRVIP